MKCSKKITFLFIGIFFVLIFSIFNNATPAHAATTWYANSISGSDITGNGSSINPFATFSAAYNKAVSGDTINLTGTFNESNPAEASSTVGSGFIIQKNLTIIGQGPGQTIVEASSTENTANRSVFTISASTLTIENMTIRYGRATNGSQGAGISNTGTLTLINDDITNNDFTAGSTSEYGAGGVFDYAGIITIASSTVENNTFDGGYYGAGGVWVLGNDFTSTINLTNSTISNNSANSTQSFGAYSSGAPAGGIGSFRFCILKITDSTIADNTTNTYGGGANLYYSKATIINSTIANNTATLGAGGILWQTLSSGETLGLENDIIAGNTSTTSDDFYSYDSTSATDMTDGGYNIIVASTNKTFSAMGDLTGTQSNLNLASTLATNGSTQGPKTLALESGSVAINAGTTTTINSIAVPTTDERGAIRIGATDIGAYEYGGLNPGQPPVISAVASSTTAGTATITWTTDSTANSIVNYGLTKSYSSASTSPTLTTAHSITITGLASSTTYHFDLSSTDYFGNATTSIDYTFATPDTTPPTVSITTPATGATLSGTTATLTADASDNVAVAGVKFYVDGITLGNEITSAPYTISWNITTTSPGTHTVFATARDTSNNYATSSSVSFTVDNNSSSSQSPISSTQNESTNPIRYGCTDPNAANYKPWAASLPSLCQYATVATTTPIKAILTTPPTALAITPTTDKTNVIPFFTRWLKNKMSGPDVLMLQRYLNANGFALATSGPGSAGQETSYFGPKTKAALIAFQNAHATEILTPAGLSAGTGFFGPNTIRFINSSLR